MVFLVRETLTEEDWAAWRSLVAQRKRTARKKYRKAVRSWLGNKLCGIGSTVFGALMLYAVIRGGMGAGWGVLAPVLIVIGPWTFLTAGRNPVWEPSFLPGFPSSGIPDAPVKAAFFGDGCFVLWNAPERDRRGYSSITAVWEDGERFYLFFQDRPPLVLPKRGFSKGAPESFRDFLEDTLGFLVELVK